MLQGLDRDGRHHSGSTWQSAPCSLPVRSTVKRESFSGLRLCLCLTDSMWLAPQCWSSRWQGVDMGLGRFCGKRTHLCYPWQTSSGGQLGLGNEFDYWRPTVIDTLEDEEGRTLPSLKLECLASLLWNGIIQPQL